MGKKATAFLGIIIISALVLPFSIKITYSSPTRSIPAIVSTDWLNANLGLTNLVVLDVRSPDLYDASHIPGAINVPEGMWYANPPFGANLPWMEMPSEDYLFELIGDAGIKNDSLVVVVGGTSGPLVPMPLALYSIAGITRVAMTLLYAGVENVAILDGGYDKWVADGYSTESGTVRPTPVTYIGTVKSDTIVDKQYVANKLGEAIIIDARDAEVYLGFIQEPWAARPGHIPTARNFPTPWLWNLNLNVSGTGVIYGTYKNVDILEAFADCIVGANKSKEIIVYCGVGGYASTMYFVLSEVLNYTNVKVYDGSAQEWTSDLTLPVVYEDLGSEYMELQNNYDQLQSNYEQLRLNYIMIQSNLTELVGKCFALESVYNTLSAKYDELEAKYDELTKTTMPAYLTYLFIATTVVFAVIAIYVAGKVKTTTKR
ncbi:MAG: sulfurtransferase [Candidatus Bathyarchaeia archaeon]